jgi:hypothetical protein
MLPIRLILLSSLVTGLVFTAFPQAQVESEKIRFGRDIRPILSDRCFQCHGRDPSTREEDLRLDLQEEATADRGGYAVIVPGNPGESELWLRVNSDDPDEFMPPTNSHKPRLNDEELEKIRLWIQQGAEYEAHWAFVPPEKPPVPSSPHPWPRNEIDSFILEKLSASSISPNEVAENEALVRRLYLDLTGLPPTPSESNDFLSNHDPQAYSNLVQSLLYTEPYASRYAERMATPWLDAARYADTNGIHMDAGRQMWKWRDWVLDAFRDGMPFDQFLREQLAGDLLSQATLSQKVASGFNRNHVITDEGGAIDEEYLVEYAADRTNTMGSVFLALNLNCARCHDHKFDPVTQEDYFSLFAYFNSNEEPGLYSQLPNPKRAFEPFIQVPTKEQELNIQGLEKELQKIQAELDAPNEKDDSGLEKFLISANQVNGVRWSKCRTTNASSLNGSNLTIQSDESVLASGENPDKDVHEIIIRTQGKNQRLILLEALQDETLPLGRIGRPGNGNAVLSFIEAKATSVRNPSQTRDLKFDWAWADHEQENLNFDVVNLLDSDTEIGWAVDAHKTPGGRTALLLTEKPFGFDGGTDIRVRLHYQSIYAKHVLGRVRLTAGSISPGGLRNLPVADSRWYATWPYKPIEGEAGYDTIFGPEEDASIDLYKKYPPDSYTWVFRGDLLDGAVNNQLPAGTTVSFVGKRIYSPSQRKWDLSLGSDDGIQVFLDGKMIFENRIDRGAAPDQEKLTLNLSRGEHSLVLKIINTGGTGGFYFQPVKEDIALNDSLVWALVSNDIRNLGVENLNKSIASDWRKEHSPTYRKVLENKLATEKELEELREIVPLTMVMKELETPKPTFVLMRGEYDKPDNNRPVSRSVPASLGRVPESSHSDRRGLADWLVHNDNPLVARVFVNRIWEMIFGTGIVSSSSDFGLGGAWPSHPELLDWLAVEFRESGWDIKSLITLIVTSKTYQQSSKFQPDGLSKNPDNSLLWAYPRRRLGAEEIRDQALYISGLLREKFGGPSVKPYQPEGLWKEVAMPQSNTRTFERGEGEELWRRTLYTYWKRASPPPALLTLDAPTREFCSVNRGITNTPLQALLLWNDEQFVEAARALAQDSLSNGSSPGAMFARCTGRSPTPEESEYLQDALASFKTRFEDSPSNAEKLLDVGETPLPSKYDAPDLAAWTMLANAILSLDEVISKN